MSKDAHEKKKSNLELKYNKGSIDRNHTERLILGYLTQKKCEKGRRRLEMKLVKETKRMVEKVREIERETESGQE